MVLQLSTSLRISTLLIVSLAVVVTVFSVTPNCTDVRPECGMWFTLGLCMAWPRLPEGVCPLSCNNSFHCPEGWSQPDLVHNCTLKFAEGLGDTPEVQQQCPTTFSLVRQAGNCTPFPDTRFPHATITTNRTNPFTKVEFRCDPGYENLNGTRVFEHTCNFSAMWQPNNYVRFNEPPNCWPICNDTKSGCPANTTLDECYFKPEATWEKCANMCQTPVLCNASSGDKSIDCGLWAKKGQCEMDHSQAQIQCPYTCWLRSTVNCSDPPEIPGAVVYGGRRYMETIHYECAGDSVNVGGLHVCSGDGTWIRASNSSGEDPSCPTTIVIPTTSSDVLTSTSAVIEMTTVVETSTASSEQIASLDGTTYAVQPSSTEGMTFSSQIPADEATTTTFPSLQEISSFFQEASPQISTEIMSSNMLPFESRTTILYSQASPSEAITPYLQPSSTEKINSVTDISSTEETISLQPSTIDSMNISGQPTLTMESTTESTTPLMMTASNEAFNSSSNPTTCGCRCVVAHNTTQIRINVQEIRENLTLDKTLLSMYRRRYVSMPDDRISAKSTGAVGVIIIITTVLLFIIPDALKVVAYIAGRNPAARAPVGRVTPSP